MTYYIYGLTIDKTIKRFGRVLLRGSLYASQQKETKRNDSACSYRSLGPNLCYGRIKSFAIIASATEPFCFLRQYYIVNKVTPLTALQPPSQVEIRQCDISNHISSIVVGTSGSSSLVAIPLCSIARKCVTI